MTLLIANMTNFIAEKSDWSWATNIFTFIGVVVCILVTLIAIVWLTCFFVKLLVKTFNVRIGKSYDLMVEDITKKSDAKKERNEKKRQAKFEQKNELLNMKLESKQKIHEMKKFKLSEKLEAQEKSTKEKLFGEDAENVKVEVKKQTPKTEQSEKQTKAEKKEKEAKEPETEESKTGDEE